MDKYHWAWEPQRKTTSDCFESGHGTPMDHWDRILAGVSDLAPLITYDRPGIGESEPDNEMPTIKNVSNKLVKILKHLDVKPPYVLVGHSLGGAYVRGLQCTILNY